MKKIIIPVITALICCGTVQAQATQKTAQKGITTASVKTTANEPVAKNTKSIAPAKTTLNTSSSAHVAIHRKHHRKARHPKIKKQ